MTDATTGSNQYTKEGKSFQHQLPTKRINPTLALVWRRKQIQQPELKMTQATTIPIVNTELT